MSWTHDAVEEPVSEIEVTIQPHTGAGNSVTAKVKIIVAGQSHPLGCSRGAPKSVSKDEIHNDHRQNLGPRENTSS
jgi:hypothetical protein